MIVFRYAKISSIFVKVVIYVDMMEKFKERTKEPDGAKHLQKGRVQKGRPEEMPVEKTVPMSEHILNSISYPLVMLNNSNIILFANLACESFFRASISLLQGRNIENFLPYKTPAIEMLEHVRHRMAAICEYKVDLSSPRLGPNSVTDIVATPYGEKEGHVVMIFQKRAMANKMDSQLNHLSAARTVTGLAAMLAHEIKNPLSGIRGAAQLLGKNAEPDERALSQLITDETDRIVSLVDQMEVFSDERPPAHDPVNVHSVLDTVKNIAINGFGRDVEFIENYDPSLPHVYANRDQLVQVFINLVKNACEAMVGVDQPQLIISTAFRSGIKISSSINDERISLPLEFTIRDNGCGIQSNIISHVFDPFITTKSNGKGLGLALVSKIIGDHRGIIEIESQTTGTLMRILMPAWQQDNRN